MAKTEEPTTHERQVFAAEQKEVHAMGATAKETEEGEEGKERK